MERPGVLSYHYLLFMPAFMPAASVFVLSIIIVSPKEHPGLGAASARRQRAFLRVRWQDGGDGRGERRRLWRVELGAGGRGVGGGVVQNYPTVPCENANSLMFIWTYFILNTFNSILN